MRKRVVAPRCFAVFAVTGVLGIASSAAAAPIVYFGEDRGVFTQAGAATGAGFANSAAAEASFLAALTGVGTESFELYPDDTGAPLLITFPGAGTATLNGTGAVDNDPATGQNAIDGTNWWRTGAGGDFTIDFTAPVSAFGFYGIDVGDIGAQLTLTLTNGNTVALNIPHTLESGGPGSGQNGSVIFFGYIDSDHSWTRAALGNVGGGGADDFGFDRMTIGTAEQVTAVVPEPTSLVLLGTGVAGLIAKARRRRKQQVQ
jgi:hypothetical protein